MALSLSFDAVVGQPEAQLALKLIAVDPSIGGVLLVGPPGSAKTTLARGLAELLDDGAPFVEIPLGATEDRVKGSIDVSSLLADGQVQVRNGLLHSADGGVLYVDEINLLADHIVDLVLDAAATGVNRVERDTISVTQPARFSLIGTMNPEEGELRPQLLDRFAMMVRVEPLFELRDRELALRRRMQLDEHGGIAPVSALGSEDGDLVAQIHRARARLGHVALGGQLEGIARRCIESGVGSLRTDIALAKAARAHASLIGRESVVEADVDAVFDLITRHRERMLPPQQASHTPDRSTEPPPSSSQRSEGSDEPRSASQPDRSPSTQDAAEDHADAPQGGESSEPLQPSPSFAESLGSIARIAGDVTGQGGELGRFRELKDNGAFSLTNTLIAHLERGGRGNLEARDVRFVEIKREVKRCVVFVVDASGSVAGQEAVTLVAEAVEQLLGTAYRERAQVAVVAFGGDRAEVTLRPTRSLEVARTRLQALRRHGRTPLARGLAVGRTLALDLRRRGIEPLLVVLTDARPNEVDSHDPFTLALTEAGSYAESQLETVVVDLESNSFRLGFAEQLAEHAGALYVRAQAS